MDRRAGRITAGPASICPLLPYFIGLGADIEQMCGHDERALRHLGEAKTLASELNEHWYDPGLLLCEARIVAAGGRTDEAKSLERRARNLARQQGARLFVHDSHRRASSAPLVASTGGSDTGAKTGG